jgi:hypothetical protein
VQATANPYAELLKTWGGLAGVISLLISVFVLLRSLYLDRSHMWLIHRKDETEQSFVRTTNPQTFLGTATLIVTNNSSRPNAINKWHATVKDRDGNKAPVNMLLTKLTDFPPFNVTPLAVPSFSSVEAHLSFDVDVRTLPNPVVFEVMATDRTRKAYRICISIPNDVRNTFS